MDTGVLPDLLSMSVVQLAALLFDPAVLPSVHVVMRSVVVIVLLAVQ